MTGLSLAQFLEPIRISHVIQNIIMVIIFEYIIYIEFGYIEIIMYNIYIQYNIFIHSPHFQKIILAAPSVCPELYS